MPLVLRQIPIWNGDLIEGFVDLALERAFVYREHKASEVIALEGGNLDREKEARFSMLEKLADHDDELMEQLLEDIPPPRDKVFDDLAKELRDGLVVPVLWSGLLHPTLNLLNPLLASRIDWFWFVASQVAFGVVAGAVVVRRSPMPTLENVSFAFRAGIEAPGTMSPREPRP